MNGSPEVKGETTKVWDHRLEMMAAFLLGLAAVATSWGTYQSVLWDGDQASHYSQATAIRAEAAQSWVMAGQMRAIDIGSFMQWLNAHLAKDAEREQFYRNHFRPEFTAAFDAWMAKNPRINPEAGAGPFFMPQYKLSLEDKAKQLDQLADRAFKEGERANKIGDRYVLSTVTLSVVLFFAGVANQFSHFYSRAAMLGVAALMCIWAIAQMSKMPVN